MNTILDNYHSPFLGQLKNRIVMSAMTRGFASEKHLCTHDILEYYERRAKDGIGLIITEGIIIHPSADGYNRVPHLYTNEQAKEWKKVTDAVHNHNTKIFAQLWHCGRISHSDFTNGETIVSSTNKPAEGINRQNNKPFGTPRALKTDEIPMIYDMFMNSADKAFDAGFDGVEIHMGHGYLIDQFLDSRINDRNDKYGGSIENRCRIALELTEQLLKKFGPNKILLRLSPSRMMGGLYEWPELDDMINYLFSELEKLGLRLIDISCANADYHQTSGKSIRKIRKLWKHTIIGGASLSVASANSEIRDGYLDLVTWGRAILANPDFVTKLKELKPLQTMTDEMRTILY
ncbi:MAG: alkene reductase [Sphingobacteriaceae bacterium]|nr:alkene reductase [Sphingobacteriaceae bacterium]